MINEFLGFYTFSCFQRPVSDYKSSHLMMVCINRLKIIWKKKTCFISCLSDFSLIFLDTGFPVCPPDLQDFITTRYHQWYTMNPKFWAILWSTDENQEIVMELLKAGCKLEVGDLARQTKIFNLFFENLVVCDPTVMTLHKIWCSVFYFYLFHSQFQIQ